MATIIPLDGTLAVFRFSLVGDLQPMVITLGLAETAGYDGTLVVQALYQAAVAVGRPFNPAAVMTPYAIEGVTCYHQTPAGFVVHEHNEHLQGTSPGNPVPSNCALLVKKVTAFGGRKNRGRMYVPPMNFTDTNVDNHGVMNDQPGLQANWNAFYVAITTDPEIPEPVVYHSDGSPGTPITSFVVDDQIATQRTRMR